MVDTILSLFIHSCMHVCVPLKDVPRALTLRRNLILIPEIQAERFGYFHYLPSCFAVLYSAAESSSALRVRDMKFQRINCFMVVLQ
jgi:hypothetical protein